MKKLTASDLREHIFAQLEIGLTNIHAYDEDDQYPQPVSKSSKKETLLSADEIKQQFDVSDEVASKLAGYQKDILSEFRDAIAKVVEQSDRYLEVKQFLSDKRYDYSFIAGYVDQNMSKKDLDPRRYVYRRVAGVVISFALLGLTAAAVRNPQFNVGVDQLGGWLIASTWGGLTLLAALAIPKGYRTRKLLTSLQSTN